MRIYPICPCYAPVNTHITCCWCDVLVLLSYDLSHHSVAQNTADMSQAQPQSRTPARYATNQQTNKQENQLVNFHKTICTCIKLGGIYKVMCHLMLKCRVQVKRRHGRNNAVATCFVVCSTELQILTLFKLNINAIDDPLLFMEMDISCLYAVLSGLP